MRTINQLRRKYEKIQNKRDPVKSACPEGNELSIGWGISGKIPWTASIAPGLHWGIPRLIIA